MTLRGKRPTAKTKRLKALFYGPAGSGKTTAAIGFPRPYLIDTERGAENDQYVNRLNDQGGAYLFTTDPDELIAEAKSLISEKHEYRTLIIDPLTIIYNALLDAGIEEKGEEFGRYKIPADRKIKQLLALLLRLDMNVIITSHAKPKWVRSKDSSGKDTAVQEGFTFDCYGRLDYLFDLVFEVQLRGRERVGVVRKTRCEGFPESEVFPFSYDEIATRYGRDVLERDANPVVLATRDAANTFAELVSHLSNHEAIVAKLLKEYDANDLTEVPAERVRAGIDHFKKLTEEEGK